MQDMHMKRDRKSGGSLVNELCTVLIYGQSDKKNSKINVIVALNYTVWSFASFFLENVS